MKNARSRFPSLSIPGLFRTNGFRSSFLGSFFWQIKVGVPDDLMYVEAFAAAVGYSIRTCPPSMSGLAVWRAAGSLKTLSWLRLAFGFALLSAHSWLTASG